MQTNTIAKIAFSLFVLDTVIQLWGEVVHSREIIAVTKPLLMPLLTVWFWACTKYADAPKAQKIRRYWILGLLFSTFGDVLLLFAGHPNGGIYFLLGLSAFLSAHLWYIVALNKLRDGRVGFIQKTPLWALPFLGYIIGLLWVLWQGIPDAMKAPVTIYALVISTMLLSVLQLRGLVPSRWFWVMMSGAALFALSDSMIALNKFGLPFPVSGLAIMVTYIIGQALLAWGVWRAGIST
jgi:uncharacterized membrane protein YhhN